MLFKLSRYGAGSHTGVKPVNLFRIATLLLSLQFSLYLSWALLLRVDFLYPLWYDLLAIEDTINEYAPQNLHRHGFEETSRQTRLQIFSEIVQGIRLNGIGLDAISYHTSMTDKPVRFLTKAELTHLIDVSELVTAWNTITSAFLPMYLILVFFMRRWAIQPFHFVKAIRYTLIGVACMSSILILAGPEYSFNALHRLVFPADHVWFFPYRLSLMATIMKAPVLFGPIALAMASLALIIHAGMLYALTLLWAER